MNFLDECTHVLRALRVVQTVFRYIQQEYTRACLIAYESRPKDGYQEGWGRPGTNYEGVRFRTSLLDTVRKIGMSLYVVHASRVQLVLRQTRSRTRSFPGTRHYDHRHACSITSASSSRY